MTINKGLLCAILRKIEVSTDNHFLDNSVGKDVIDTHLQYLKDAGLIVAEMSEGTNPPSIHFIVQGLTPAGYEYLEKECDKEHVSQ